MDDSEAASARADRPIPRQVGVWYWEVKVEAVGECGFIGVGIATCTFSLSRLPGNCMT